MANWSRWTEDQPEWFTANFIKRVPPDMIPMGFQDDACFQEEADSVRESVREKTVLGAKVSPEREAEPGDEENGEGA